MISICFCEIFSLTNQTDNSNITKPQFPLDFLQKELISTVLVLVELLVFLSLQLVLVSTEVFVG